MTPIEMEAFVKAAGDAIESAVLRATHAFAVRVSELEAKLAAIHVAAGHARSDMTRDIQSTVAAQLQSAIASIPAPKDGKDGRDGIDGKDGRDGRDGKDGESIRGPKGDTGEKGADGFGLEDFSVERSGDRGWLLVFQRGDVRLERTLQWDGSMLHRGIYQEGRTYEAGDCVTWAGSMWHATKATSAKPDLNTPESRAWVLVVKRGSQGRIGDRGPQGDRGEKGEKGDTRINY